MKIGFSFVDLAAGGAQTLLVQLAEGMHKRGHKIHYFLPADQLHAQKTSPTLLAQIQQVAQAVSRAGDLLACDVIHLDGYHSIRRKLPFLTSLSRCCETLHSRYSIRRSAPLFARHLVCVSQAVQKELRHPSQVIYPGVRNPGELQKLEKRFDLAILGRLHPVKNHELFLEICENLFHQRGKASAILIGGTASHAAYQRRLQARIEQLRRMGLTIQLTGEVPHERIFPTLAQARLLLVTSQQEGFGLMAVEAMACGLPVIANPVGGLLEIIQPGKTGFLAKLNQPASFVQLARRLLDDDGERARLGTQGQKLAREKFSFERTLEAYEGLFRRIAEGTERHA